VNKSENVLRKLLVERALVLEAAIRLTFRCDLPGVVLPDAVRAALQVPLIHLDIGLDLANPIPDLRIDDDGVCGSFSFSTVPGFCSFPWPAVLQLTLLDGGFKPCSHITFSFAGDIEAPKPEPRPTRPTHLRVV